MDLVDGLETAELIVVADGTVEGDRPRWNRGQVEAWFQ